LKIVRRKESGNKMNRQIGKLGKREDLKPNHSLVSRRLFALTGDETLDYTYHQIGLTAANIEWVVKVCDATM